MHPIHSVIQELKELVESNHWEEKFNEAIANARDKNVLEISALSWEKYSKHGSNWRKIDMVGDWRIFSKVRKPLGGELCW